MGRISDEHSSLLATLSQISADLSSTLRREELLPLIVKHTADALHAPACALLQDFEPDCIRAVATEGLPRSVEGRELGRAGVGLGSWVIREQAPLLVRDMAVDPRLSEAEREILVEGQGLRVFLGVPLRAVTPSTMGRSLGRRGCLAVYYFCPQEIQESDIQMLVTLAGQASISLDNARLYEEQVQRNLELSMLSDIGRSLAAVLDVNPLLHRIISVTTDILGCEVGYVVLSSENGSDLRLVASRGLGPSQVDNFSLKVGQGTVGKVIQTGEARIANRVQHDPKGPEVDFDHIESLLCIPLKSRGRVIGALSLANKLEPGGFTETDLNLVTTLASQAAVAIDNAELYTHLEGRVKQATQEMMEANRQLGKRNAEMEALVHSMGDGVLVTDCQGIVLLANPAARRLLGWESEAGTSDGCGSRPLQIGQPLLPQIPEPEVAEALAQMLHHPEEGIREELRVARTGRVLSAQVTGIRDESGEEIGQVTVLTDITHLKELDRIKTDLISFVSHELRGPLSSILGYSSTLIRRADQIPPETQREFLHTIIQECDRLNRLTVDLLDITRIEEGRSLEVHLGLVSLRPLIERVVQSQRALVQGHTFEIDVPATAAVIIADEDKLEQILFNLVNNAIKYSPHGGKVRIQARRGEGVVEISVQDEGIGIPPEQIPQLFQRYHRTDASRRIKGIGIGLYLVRHLVEAHGGEIRACSTPGQGTCFTFSLPQPQERPPRRRGSEPSANPEADRPKEE
jgi:two-component system phosphate regulon sensor histidine kinase PhoR